MAVAHNLDEFGAEIGRLRDVAARLRPDAPGIARVISDACDRLVVLHGGIEAHPAGALPPATPRLRVVPTPGDEAPPRRVNPHQPAPLAETARRRHAEVERNDTRRCARCRHWLPLSYFDVKDRKTGHLRSFCRSCQREYQRERYAHVGERVVSVTVLDGDECVGKRCPGCDEPFVEGDRLVAGALHHVGCTDRLVESRPEIGDLFDAMFPTRA